MASNQCSIFELWTVNKYLVTKNCRQYEIYRRMLDVYREADFSAKNLYKQVKQEFSMMSSKDCPYFLSGKERVPGVAVSK